MNISRITIPGELADLLGSSTIQDLAVKISRLSGNVIEVEVTGVSEHHEMKVYTSHPSNFKVELRK